MARFPKIDQPCPLDADAQRNIQDHCGRCGKTVHCLDGKSDAERSEFMRQARGPVCVSYRLKAGFGAALALSLAGPVAAAGQAEAATVLTPQQAAAPAAANPLNLPAGPASTLQSPLPGEESSELIELVMVGGISNPDEAEWVEDDTSLPELPMRTEPSRD